MHVFSLKSVTNMINKQNTGIPWLTLLKINYKLGKIANIFLTY